jgi:NitT/TauT family transport system substrate-binding protein
VSDAGRSPVPPLSRRDFCRLGAAAVLASVLPSTGCSPARPLRIAEYPWPGYEFLRLGQRFGWTSPDLVELRRTAGHRATIEALRRADVDAATLTLDEVLCLRGEGTPVSIVLVFDFSAGADALLARPAVATLADLRGARIGVESTGLGDIMLAKVLERAGLRREDVTIVPLADDHVAAWRAGALDAIVTYEPSALQLEKAGLVRRFDSREAPQLIVDVLAVRTESLRRHARALRAAIDGHFRVLRRWQQNPVDTGYHLAAGLGIEPDECGRVLRGLDLPDLAYNRQYLTAPADDLRRAAREIDGILRASGRLRGALGHDDLFVPDFLPGEDA